MAGFFRGAIGMFLSQARQRLQGLQRQPHGAGVDAPVRSELGVLQYTTSSTSAP
ncbi:hypothetical protein WJ970_26825 [Achromobacter xylosoxidans]